jgi:hypothetical protein
VQFFELAKRLLQRPDGDCFDLAIVDVFVPASVAAERSAGTAQAGNYAEGRFISSASRVRK